MVEVSREAARLPQDDDRVWKYHPVPVRYRRLLRRWWALPAAEGLIRSSDREKYKILFGPAMRDNTMGWYTPHANTGGHLKTLHDAIPLVTKLTPAEWEKYSAIKGSLINQLPELTRKAVHAIYRALPELRKRDVPTQFNLWST